MILTLLWLATKLNVSTAAKKITIVHLVYGFDVGGLECIIKNTIESLPDYYEHHVVCLTDYSPSFVETIVKPINVIALRKPAGQSWSTFSDFFTVLKRIKPDILHSYNLATLEFQVVGFLLRIPFRLHVEHGRDVSDPDGSNKKYQWLRRLVTPFVHKVVSVSDDLHQWLIETVKLPKRKCKLIRNGVNTALYTPRASSTPLEQKEGRDLASCKRVRFGHVARLQAIKNQHGLITSYISACEKNEDFKQHSTLIIVGDGALKKQLYALAQQSSCREHIEFWGVRQDMPKVYQSFDVFTMSSDAEGVPMTMLEAMSCGLPVLSTDVGGISEITHSNNALLVPAKNTAALTEGFLSLYSKRMCWAEMGESARNSVVADFSQVKMMSDYQSTYETGINYVRN